MRLAFHSGKLRVRWPDRARGWHREGRRIRVTDRPLMPRRPPVSRLSDTRSLPLKRRPRARAAAPDPRGGL